MEIKLLKFNVKGIKNIKDEISIDFYKQNITNFDFSNYRIKGIFGRNGIGKTAIIKAIDILKNIVLDKKYLYRNENIVKELINKETKKLELEVQFYFSEEKLKLFNHKIVITYDKDINIIYEHIEIRTLKKKISKKIVQENGVIKEVIGFSSKESLNNGLINLLLNNSFIREIHQSKLIKENSNYRYINSFIIFYLSVKTSFHIQDIYINKNQIIVESLKNNNILPNGIESFNKFEGDVIVPIKLLEDFKEHLIKLTKFLVKFIPKIKSMDYKIVAQDENNYYINYLVNYGDYNISLEFESMGLKNLKNLYVLVEGVYQGYIVFIDEIDLSIHTVYLEKLIEFISEYSKGQLIFTAHNVELLEILNKYKNSINFIDSNQSIQKWVQKGTLNPIKAYKEGRIGNMAFNIEAYEFGEVFGEENED